MKRIPNSAGCTSDMKRLIFLLLTLCVTSNTYANPITTLELRHRPAEELIPILRPLLGPEDSISGQGFVLFLRSSADTRRQIQSALRSLDVAPRSLLISVFQGSERDLRNLHLQGRLRHSLADTDADVSIASTRARLRDNPIHQLRVSEGVEGYIETGRSIPFLSTLLIGSNGIAAGQEYHDVGTGFYVVAHQRGDQVRLRISPFRESADPRRGGEVSIQRAQTTLSGPLGEWLPIGGITQGTTRTSRDNAYHSTRERDDSGVWIKAQPAP